MPRSPEEIPDDVLELVLCDQLGATVAWKMINHTGSIAAARKASARLWNSFDTVRNRGQEIVNSLAQCDAALERKRMRDAGTVLVAAGDHDYPPLLMQIPVPPLALWIRGSIDALGAVPVAVVGARNCTAYGVAQAGRFAGHLSEEGVTIVSGGARGIDAEAHRAALRVGGATVAVLGCGLGATPYPPQHAELFANIVDSGGMLMSEFPTHWPVLQENFPRRNRVIAGLAVAVLVIEAGVSSGALITARHAHDEQERPVYALPGPVDSRVSEGCNRAIRDDLAASVLNPEELMEELRSKGLLLAAGARSAAARDAHASVKVPLVKVPPALEHAVALIRGALRKERNADCARLVELTGLPAHQAQAALTLVQLSPAQLFPKPAGS